MFFFLGFASVKGSFRTVWVFIFPYFLGFTCCATLPWAIFFRNENITDTPRQKQKKSYLFRHTRTQPEVEDTHILSYLLLYLVRIDDWMEIVV